MRDNFTLYTSFFHFSFYITFSFLFFIESSYAQELYVFSNPASNVPARSLSLKYASKWVRGERLDNSYNASRQMMEAQVGASNKLMFRSGFSFSDMYTYKQQQFESFNIGAKYRFLSRDGVHKHFRAAAFLQTVYSRNNLMYDELTAEGDHSVVQGGLILTQLMNKLAISGTLAVTQVINPERWLKYAGPRNFGYQGLNYSLSGGYLVLPRKYRSYKQPNLNFYLELLGGLGLDRTFSYIDLAPAIQLILNSNSKINAGYKYQLVGDAYRMTTSGVYFSFERTFLNSFNNK